MKQGKYYVGAAYYPELWPDAAIEQDLKHMVEVGVNIVRMGEFAWSTMEPNEDEISLDFFVDVIGRLHAKGIETIFCTPTPTPPIWLSHEHPERLFVDSEGRTLGHGARQHPCTNNPYFRKRSRIITEAIGKAVGKLPGVVAWQTDNEFKCHVADCTCGECRTQWHAWLTRRYGTITALNQAWGTHAWSQYYQRFDQVPPPVITPYIHNPSLSTMYRLFTHDKIAEFQQEQIDILRRYSDSPITHNSCRGFRLDNETLFQNLDNAAYDFYANADGWQYVLSEYDLWRTIKPGKPFWVMETTTSHTGELRQHITTHPDGFVEVEALSAYASGAQLFSFWCWRQQRTGCELTTGAALSVWGEPTVGYKNVAATTKVKDLCAQYLAASIPARAQVAITYSDKARAFLNTEPQGWPDYMNLVNEWNYILRGQGIHRDFILEGADLAGYKLFMTPYCPYLSPELFVKARAFVEAGGTWIAGPLTGGRTADHAIPTNAALGELEAYAGVHTVYSYFIEGTGAVGDAFGVSAPLEGYSYVFEPCEASVVGTITGGVTPGLGFLTEHRVGAGKVVLLGSRPQGDEGQKLLAAIFEHYAAEAGVTLRSESSIGTAVIPRQSPKGLVWVVVNMDGAGGTVTVPSGAVDLTTGESVDAGSLSIGPYGYRFLRFDR